MRKASSPWTLFNLFGPGPPLTPSHLLDYRVIDLPNRQGRLHCHDNHSPLVIDDAFSFFFAIQTFVVHTVGPRGEHPRVLESCYNKCLDLLKENNLKSIAFPCISTGIFGYPNLNAAKVALGTIRKWLEKEEYAENVERIIMCLFLKKDIAIYDEQMQLYFPIDRGETGNPAAEK
ncbi:O-acetyl-ADP-ribose deacetylase MACROD2-like protein [Elysia marginata]|uniref:O-acetyl-ADP-ribose deacetylase MACROD2-like protein n=1 Tax=Elysia marginata TaxID=1093978 RepID=A0AAV4HPD9_9GAST|nr:O-acetyl-ADP-ribose deacetylase MACROD2-like protein [Elysia marginata]